MINSIKLKTLFLSVLLAYGLNAHAKTYQIEVVIFDQMTQPALSEEHYPEPRDWPDFKQAQPISALPSSAFTLQGVVNALNKTSDYQVIGHFSWLEEGRPASSAIPVLIRNADIEGTITFSQGRFAQISSNLIYTQRGQEYQLKESSRLEYNKLYYFDHPMFGMVVSVKPYM